MTTLTHQKPTKRSVRKKKSRAAKGTRWSSVLSLALSLPLRFLDFAIKFSKTRPRTVIGMSACGLLIFAGTRAKQSMNSYQESVLPKQALVTSSSDKLKLALQSTADKTIADATKRNMPRTEFVKLLSKNIENIDSVDEYSVRSGLDGKLQISASSQIPVMIVDTNGEKFVVSNKMRIMAKNPDEQDYPKILQVTAPEIKINWHPKLILSKDKQLQKFGKMVREDSASANFGWLFRQANAIQKSFFASSSDYQLEKISWKSSAGFGMTLKRSFSSQKTAIIPLTESQQAQSQEELASPIQVVTTSVILGHADFAKKLEKLNEILRDLSSRKLIPQNIDLNFQDKALIKISENLQLGPL